MAGESWRELTQVGKETTYGVAVPATRQLLMETGGTGLTRTRAAHVIQVATGTPDNVRGVKNRAVAAGGGFKQTLDADEIVELLLACIQGGVTPVASAAIANPTTAVTAVGSATGGSLPAATYTYQITDVGPGGAETAANTASTGYVASGTTSSVALSVIAAGASGTLQRRIYRSAGAAYGLIAVLNDNTTTTYSDTGAVTQAVAIANGAPPATNQTGTGANIWTFIPSTTIDSQTWEWRDGYNDWQESGVYIDTLKLTWSAAANGDTMLDVTLFGKDRVNNALTSSLATRSPIWVEGWETSVFLDTLGSAPGTTRYGTAISGDVTISRGLGRKYFANNSQATGSVPLGVFGCTGTMVLEGDSSSLVEYADWDASVARMLRLRFGSNGAALGASALRRTVFFDVPCFWTAWDLSGADAGTKVAKATFQYSYDPTNGFSFRAIAVNNRTTAYA